MSRKSAWLIAAGVAAVAIGAAAVGAVALLVRGGSRPGEMFASGGYLAIDLAGDIPEGPPPSMGGFFESRPPSIRGLVEAVDRAARDGRVKGLLLRVSSVGAGWARVQELRDALVRFKRTGKPSCAYLESPGNLEYLLATGCTKVALAPTALLDVSGLAAEISFYRGTLDKLGIEAQFEGVGKYKNAPNQLTERGFTEPHREQMNALVDGLFEQYVEAIAHEPRARAGRRARADRPRALPGERGEGGGARRRALVPRRGGGPRARRTAGSGALRALGSRGGLRPPAEARPRLRGRRPDAGRQPGRPVRQRRGLRHDHPGAARRRARTRPCARSSCASTARAARGRRPTRSGARCS